MAIDHERIDKFLAETVFKSKLGNLVRKCGFEITWLRASELSGHVWGLYLKPNQPLQEMTAAKREILLWHVDFDDYQPRTLTQATEILVEERPRLSEQIVIIVTPHPDTSELVNSTSEHLPHRFVGFSESEIIEYSARDREDFLRLFQSRLFFRDLYWVSTPLQNPKHFYGRRKHLDEVASSLVTAQIPIGLFGLRKMGKTSFLYRLLETLQQSRCYLCYLDLELIVAVNPSAEYFLWSLGTAVLHSLGRFKPQGLQLLGKWQSFSSIDDKESIPELFIHDMRAIFSQTNRVIVVAIDEIELMAPLEITGVSQWSGDCFVKIWRILRGLAQQYPQKITFFITGTNPKLIEVSRIGGVDNPIYNFFRKDYLKPLHHYDSRRLLKDIGTLVGLEWSEEAITIVHQRVGGHPLLLRAYGSLIYKKKLPRITKVRVTVDDVVSYAQDFMLEVNSQLSQMLDVLHDYYRDEYMLLEMLALGRVSEFREYSASFPEEIAHLKGYGLIEFSQFKCDLIVEPLQTWIQRKHRSTAMPHLSSRKEGDPIIGKNIDGYLIEASIGHTGGFARVYRAYSEKFNGYAAIKILTNGILSTLQREVDVLSEIRHPNIVRMLDSGRTPDGVIYLIMEYLEGNTLRSYCDRTSRLAPEQVHSIARKLLSALISLHPDTDLVERLRSKQELSAQEYAALERARHGKIHRDIKPENVVLTEDRGPVLIDFNISVAASEQQRTQSHTPGYLPPDMTPGPWTPDVDLYQMGITLAQVATGIGYHYNDTDGGNNLRDIRDHVNAELPRQLSNVILKLCSPRRHQRFSSAREALRRLQ